MSVCGIDVSSTRLDYAVSRDDEPRSVPYSTQGMNKMVHELRRAGVDLIVMEASGGYEVKVRGRLHKLGFRVAVVNAARVRSFARAMGELAKTDPIDARVITRFGEVMELHIWQEPSPAQGQLTHLVRRRSQLIEDKTREENRQKLVEGPALSSIKRCIKAIKRELARIDQQVFELVKSDESLRQRCERLCTVPGVALITAAAIMAYCPELGSLRSRKVASLAGVAPFAKESGHYHGQRCIRGGRPRLRNALYMAALVGSRWNPPLAEFYKRQLARGKAKKVALVACMNKLIRWLNAMERDQIEWSQMETAHSVA